MANHRRRFNITLIKRTVSYSIDEVASLFGVHKGTVRNWFKQGLKRIDSGRPYLVHGSDLADFIKARQDVRKQKCQPNEAFCFRCRQPRRPKDNRVILKKLNQKVGRIHFLCAECGSKTNRTISLRNLSYFRSEFEVIEDHEAKASIG